MIFLFSNLTTMNNKKIKWQQSIFCLSFLLIKLNQCVYSLPEEHMNVEQIAEFYGYPIETFDATTPDGYILKIHRIPFGVKENSQQILTAKYNSKARPIFFLQHGLLASSADWITNLPTQSLGFLLADAGFDVWMGNVRGNVYSRDHVNLSRNSIEYWQFTWDEMARYDLPIMIDTALNVTKQTSLYYVGHSQGTEIMFAQLASDQNLAKKIKKFFALAPVTTITYIKGILKYIAEYFGGYTWIFTKFFGSREFLPSTYLKNLFARLICGKIWTNPLCYNFLFQIGGPETDQFNTTRLLVYMSHTPAGTSTWNIFHWSQIYRSKKMQKFDYGSDALNFQHYQQNVPPIYNLTQVNAPTYLYYSDADWLADTTDINNSLLNVIPKKYLKLNKKLPKFNHFDFIWGLKAPSQIYAEIIETANNHND